MKRTAFAALTFVLATGAEAQTQAGKLFARADRPLRSARLDLGTGTITLGPTPKDRAATTVADFYNMDLSGFIGVDTGGGFCEWFDAGAKGFAGNNSDMISSITFAYCSSKLSVGSGGPGGSVRLGFYEGYLKGGGTPTTTCAAFTLTGLPANTASASFFTGYQCYAMTVDFAPAVCWPDGPIGYSWRFLDSGTGTVNPTGATLAATWPFLACVASCSAQVCVPDGQGMADFIDEYCPPGFLRSTFTFGTTSGTYTSMAMQMNEIADVPGTVVNFNSVCCPNPDLLMADPVRLGQTWSATLTLGIARAAGTWALYFDLVPPLLVLPFNGFNIVGGAWGPAGAPGKRLLCGLASTPSCSGGAHTGALFSNYTTNCNGYVVPKSISLVCREWCTQAVIIGNVGGGGGLLRLSSAARGIIGTF